MESILTSIKKMLGITEDYEHFDEDLIIHINSVFSILTQLGVGPPNGFSITGSNETWNEFMQDSPRLSFVKTFVELKVRLIFDPPLNSSVTDSINNQLSELEWRIFVESDSTDSEVKNQNEQ